MRANILKIRKNANRLRDVPFYENGEPGGTAMHWGKLFCNNTIPLFASLCQ